TAWDCTSYVVRIGCGKLVAAGGEEVDGQDVWVACCLALQQTLKIVQAFHLHTKGKRGLYAWFQLCQDVGIAAFPEIALAEGCQRIESEGKEHDQEEKRRAERERQSRSEEHTSELQSRENIVC